MISARTLALGVAVVAVLSLATPTMAAHADTSPLPVVAADTPQPVIAADTTPAPGTRPVALVGVDPDIVNGLTVTGHLGHPVKATAKGQRTRIVTAGASTPAVLRALIAGVTYTISIGGKPVAKATPVAKVGPATNLVVRITPTPGQIHLTWSYTPRRVEGANVSFAIVATPQGPGPATATPFHLEATGTEAALEGLDPDRLYTITVTPRNTASTGRATSATMSKTLNEITGGASVPPAPVPTPAVPVTPTPAPAPVQVPGPAPAPAPGPAPTKTIYICPDGYTETSTGACQKAMAYTFHRVTETTPYTYHQESQVNTVSVPATFNGTVWTWSCPSGYDAGGGQWGVGICKGTVQATVKDYPPTGWYDTGSNYARDIDVKDPAPSGYTDDGTQWVTVTSKVAKIVPA
jgi:antitoxin (DNA-binding transcriptional repressor) of toxin-antitoxin stability system